MSSRPSRHATTLADALQGLLRKEVVFTDAQLLSGEDAYRFGHILVRDAAYRGVPKETRAELHERFATFLADSTGDRVAEYEEIIGYHLEQAFGFRMELGPAQRRRRGPANPRPQRGSTRPASGRSIAATCRRRSTSSSALRRSPRAWPTTPSCRPASRRVLLQLGQLAEAEALLERGARNRPRTRATSAGPHTPSSASSSSCSRPSPQGRTARSSTLTRASGAVCSTAHGRRPRLGARVAAAQQGRATRLPLRGGGGGARASRSLMPRPPATSARRRRSGSGSATASADGPTPGRRRDRPLPARCWSEPAAFAGWRRRSSACSATCSRWPMSRIWRATTTAAAARSCEELGMAFPLAARAVNSARIEVMAGDLEAAERAASLGVRAARADRRERRSARRSAAILAQVLYEQGRDDEAEEIRAHERASSPQRTTSTRSCSGARRSRKVLRPPGRRRERAGAGRGGG